MVNPQVGPPKLNVSRNLSFGDLIGHPICSFYTSVLHKDEYGDILDLLVTKLVTKVFGWQLQWRIKLWTLNLRVSKRKSANWPAVTWGYAPGHKWFLLILVITGDFQPGGRARWKHIKVIGREPLKRVYFLVQ